jgi:hypothetical protein
MADPQGRPDNGDGATPPPPRKAPAQKAPARKTPAKKAPAKKAATVRVAPAKKAPAKKSTPHPIPVPPPENSARPMQESGHRIPFSIGLAAGGLFAVVLSRFRRG